MPVINLALIFAVRTEGAIAQLVEHRTENPGVAGSIPAGTTLRKAAQVGFFVFKGFCKGELVAKYKTP